VCEHRWRQIFNMVEFRNAVAGTEYSSYLVTFHQCWYLTENIGCVNIARGRSRLRWASRLLWKLAKAVKSCSEFFALLKRMADVGFWASLEAVVEKFDFQE
jgi:dihydroorotate dehydrogenase